MRRRAASRTAWIARAWPSRSKPAASVSRDEQRPLAVPREPHPIPDLAGRCREPAARAPAASPPWDRTAGSCAGTAPAGEASSARLSPSAADRPRPVKRSVLDRGAQRVAVAGEQLAFLSGARPGRHCSRRRSDRSPRSRRARSRLTARAPRGPLRARSPAGARRCRRAAGRRAGAATRWWSAGKKTVRSALIVSLQ